MSRAGMVILKARFSPSFNVSTVCIVGSNLHVSGRPASDSCGRWCGRRDSNPHIFRYQDLNLARLPVPPRPPGRRSRARITGMALGARERWRSWRFAGACVSAREEKMKYRKLGSSDLHVSEISLGSWLTYGVGVERDRAAACVDKAFELGINFIDTANIYGRGAAETFLGETLKDRPRTSYILATKLFFP